MAIILTSKRWNFLANLNTHKVTQKWRTNPKYHVPILNVLVSNPLTPGMQRCLPTLYLHLTSIHELLSMLWKYSGRKTVQWEQRSRTQTKDPAANKMPPTKSCTEHTFMTGEFLPIHRLHGNIIQKWTGKKKVYLNKDQFLAYLHRGKEAQGFGLTLILVKCWQE